MNIINFITSSIEARWKIFLISFLAGLLMVILPHLGVKVAPLTLINPAPNPPSINENIKSRLEAVEPSSFKLSQNNSYIRSASANSEYDELSGYGVINLNSGEVLASKNLSQKLPIASITKVMTAIVALDLLSPNTKITITKKDTEVEPTNMGLVEGQVWEVEKLLNALLLTSSNDAAEALKNEVDRVYGQGSFTGAMNTKAEILNLKNTHFQNPQGYDSDAHFSSVEDLSLLSKYALDNYPLIDQIVQKDFQFYSQTEEHNQADLYNWNGLLGVYPGVKGIKIGNTEKAQKTTLVISEREAPQSGVKETLLAVVLGAPGVLERDLWASQLLDLGFEKTLGLKPVGITEQELKAKYQTWKYF